MIIPLSTYFLKIVSKQYNFYRNNHWDNLSSSKIGYRDRSINIIIDLYIILGQFIHLAAAYDIFSLCPIKNTSFH